MSSGQQYQSRKATVVKEGGTCNARKYTGRSGGSQFRIVVTGEECHPCFTAFDVQKTLTVKLLAWLQQSKALKTALGGVQLLKVQDIDRMMRDISQPSVHNRPLFQTTIIPSLSSDKLPCRPRPSFRGMRGSESLHNQHTWVLPNLPPSERVLDYAQALSWVPKNFTSNVDLFYSILVLFEIGRGNSF